MQRVIEPLNEPLSCPSCGSDQLKVQDSAGMFWECKDCHSQFQAYERENYIILESLG